MVSPAGVLFRANLPPPASLLPGLVLLCFQRHLPPRYGSELLQTSSELLQTSSDISRTSEIHHFHLRVVQNWVFLLHPTDIFFSCFPTICSSFRMDFDAHFYSKTLPGSIQTSSNASKIIQKPPKIDFGVPKNRSRGPKTADVSK